MRVIHLVDDANPIGGVPTYLRRLVAALASRGWSNAVLAEVPAEIPGADEVVGAAGGPSDAGVCAALRPDVVVVHSVDSARLVGAVAEIAPTFVFEHDYRHVSPGNLRFFVRSERFCERGFGLQCLVKPYTERCNNRRPDRVAGSVGRVLAWRRVWPRLAGVLCASPFVAELLVEAGLPSDSIAVVGYPVDVPTRPVGPAAARPDLLYVGRTSPLKGIHHLLRAFATLRPRFPETRLLVAGGPDGEAVRALAAQAGVEDAVDVLGWLDERSLRAAYERSRVLAVPSVWPEPFGMVGPEAMAHGLPVVASDVGGISAWLESGRGGTLVPPGDPATLAAALGALLADADDADRLGAIGRAWVERELTADRHLELLLPLFEGARR